MKKVIVYDSIDKKNIIEQQLPLQLSSNEALIMALDMMDFFASFKHRDLQRDDDNIEWIILKRKSEISSES